MIRQFMSRQFMAFLITGGTAAAVNFGSRILYNRWLSFSNAVIIAYVTGMITAYILAKLFVFKDTQQPIHRSIFFFVLVNVAAAAQTWLISMALYYYVLPHFGISQFAKELSHAVGVAIPVFTSYIGHKRWSFGLADTEVSRSSRSK